MSSGELTDASSASSGPDSSKAPVDAGSHDSGGPGADGGDASSTDAGDSSGGAEAGAAMWKVETLPFDDSVYALGGTGPQDVYAGGFFGIYRSNGDGVWTTELFSEAIIVGLSDDGFGHMYALDEYGRLYARSDSGDWSTSSATPICGNPELGRFPQLHVMGTTVFESAPTLTCVGTATNPTAVDSTTALGETTGFSGDSEVFAISGEGDQGYVWYFDGINWQPISVPDSRPFYGTLVAVGDSVLTVSPLGIYQSIGHGPLSLVVNVPPAGEFGTAWGTSVDEVWIAGGNPSGKPGVTHFLKGENGATLAQEDVPAPGLGDYYAVVWGTGTGELYAGGNGVLAHKK